MPWEFDFSFYDHQSRDQQRPVPRGYDPYTELVNKHVVIGGLHFDKGLRGRIRLHVGQQQILRVELEAGSRLVDVHVNQLFGV